MHQTIISLVQAFAKKAGWAAEDLRSVPVGLKEKLGEDDNSPLYKGFPMTALQVGCMLQLQHSCLQTRVQQTLFLLETSFHCIFWTDRLTEQAAQCSFWCRLP